MEYLKRWDLIEDIVEYLNIYLSKFGVNCHYSTEGFEYDYNLNSIGISITYTDWNEIAFADVIKSYNPKFNADMFLWSLYHEIGHSLSKISVGSNGFKLILKKKAELKTRFQQCNELGEYISLYHEYANIDDEREATEFAVNYIEDNIDEVSALWEYIQPRLIQFYIENGVVN